MDAHPVSHAVPDVELFTDRFTGPTWDPKRKRYSTCVIIQLAVASMVILWIAALYWLFFIAQIRHAEVRLLSVGADVMIVLGPILVVALCIEQILEAIFTLVENKSRSLVAYAGYGLYWLHNAETELQEARRLLSEVSSTARSIQVDLPTAAWLKEMKEQHKQGDVGANQGITLEKEPLLRIPEASLSNLHRTIAQLFSEDELRTLCFDLGVDYDNIKGETKESTVRELIQYHYRRGLLRQLIKKCAENRADIHLRNLVEKPLNNQAEIASFEELFAAVLDKARTIRTGEYNVCNGEETSG